MALVYIFAWRRLRVVMRCIHRDENLTSLSTAHGNGDDSFTMRTALSQNDCHICIKQRSQGSYMLRRGDDPPPMVIGEKMLHNFLLLDPQTFRRWYGRFGFVTLPVSPVAMVPSDEPVDAVVLPGGVTPITPKTKGERLNLARYIQECSLADDAEKLARLKLQDDSA